MGYNARKWRYAMHDVTAAPVKKTAGGSIVSAHYEALHRRFPTVEYLRQRARRRVPNVGFDLLRRADAAGAHVLMLTLDVPVRTTRSREVAGGIVYPFRITPRMAAGVAASPGYLMSLWKHGITRFACLAPYAGEGASVNAMARFMQGEQRGAFT